MNEKIDTNKLIQHLQQKWGGRLCNMCNQSNWSVSDKSFELREYQGGDLIIGGAPIIPVIPVTCNNCGNTILVNAIVAKIINPQKP